MKMCRYAPVGVRICITVRRSEEPMKKIVAFLAVLGLCACASVNKSTVSYQMGKYDQQMYYVVSGEGADKEAASANALANMRASFAQAVPDAADLPQINDIMANAEVDKVWRDKSRKEPKNYFALAIVKRQTAELILQVPANALDARLGALAAQLQGTEDKFAGLRAAFAMKPLIEQRNVVQDLYVFISENRTGYETQRFDEYKKLYNERLAAVKVAVMVRGEEDQVLLSLITDAVNQLGLSVVGAEDSTALLSVEVDAKVDGYGSERLKGLVWAATSAAVSLRDLQAGTTFARFNVYDRAGTGRQADSLRKSMEGVGKKASLEIVKRMTDYLKTK